MNNYMFLDENNLYRYELGNGDVFNCIRYGRELYIRMWFRALEETLSFTILPDDIQNMPDLSDKARILSWLNKSGRTFVYIKHTRYCMR